MRLNKRARLVTYSVLVVVLVVLELADAGMMAMHGEIPGAATHLVLAVIFTVIAIAAYRRFARASHPEHAGGGGLLTGDVAFWPMVANLALLIIIAVHDFDHMRQAMMWGYSFTIPLLLVNFVVYVPGTVGLVLAARRTRAGAIATMIGGPLIALGFLKLHLLGAWIPVWGPWNDSFATLGADTLSWFILWVTAAVGILVGLAGAVSLGMWIGQRTATAKPAVEA